MKIGDLFLALGVDSANFKTAVQKEAEAAGKAGSSKFSSTFATGLKVGSVIVGAAFGLMAKGAIEMEKSQGKFQAATGRSREEAIDFSKAMNGIVGSAKTVGQSFEEITDTGIAVSQQFDITGQKATDLTEDILGFAKVTGQDASDAALQLEDTLSAFGLSADDAAGFMDKLVASSQKYGTDAGPATLGILQSMAPALQAMGMDLDDGVALLNAFEVAGVDAAGAQRGLNTAITKLPPGTSMEDFLQHLQDLKNQGIDPTSEAIDVFGNKAGAALALTIKPGGHALDDFRVSAEDAAGAVDKAADDMLTTNDKIRMFTEKAGAALRGLGQDFGPLVSGLGAIGALAAPLAGKLKGLFEGIAKSGPIKAAAGAAGAAASAAYSAGMKALDAITGLLSSAWTAIRNSGPAKAVIGLAGAAAAAAYSVGMKIAEVLGGALNAVWVAIGSPGSSMVKAAGLAGLNAGSAFASGVLAGLATLGVAAAAVFGQKFYDDVLKPLGDSIGGGNSVFDQQLARAGTEWGKTAGEAAGTAVVPAIIGSVDQSASQWVPLGETIGEPVGEGVSEGTAHGIITTSGTVSQAYRDMLDVAFVDAYRESQAAAQALGASIPGEIGQGMQSTANQVLDAAQGLRDLLENGLTPQARAMQVIGEDFIKLVRKGMTSQIDGAKETAQTVAIAAINTIEDAGLTGKKGQKGLEQIGRLYDQLLASGMTKEQAATALIAGNVSSAVVDGLEAGIGPAGTAGEDSVDAYNKGIAGGKGASGGGSTGGLGSQIGGGATGAAGQVRGAVVTTFSNTAGFSTYGSNTTGEYASGIDSPAAKKKATDAAHRVLDAVRAVFYTGSPPKDPILRPIGDWGEATIGEYAKGMLRGLGAVSGAATSVATQLTMLNGLTAPGSKFQMPILTGKGTVELHHTVDIRGDAGVLDERKVADYLNEGAAGFAWNLEHAMSAVTSG